MSADWVRSQAARILRESPSLGLFVQYVAGGAQASSPSLGLFVQYAAGMHRPPAHHWDYLGNTQQGCTGHHVRSDNLFKGPDQIENYGSPLPRFTAETNTKFDRWLLEQESIDKTQNHFWLCIYTYLCVLL